MNHEVIHACRLGSVTEGDEVILMRMHTSIADEPEEVQAFALGLGEGFDEHIVLGQLPVPDALVDAGEVLINDPPCAEVQVADLAVAHLAFREADILTARADAALRIGGIQVLVERCAGEQGGVAIFHCFGFAAGVDAPAVANDENYGLLGHACLVHGQRPSVNGKMPEARLQKRAGGEPALLGNDFVSYQGNGLTAMSL